MSKTRKRQQTTTETAGIASISAMDRTVAMPFVQGETEEIAEVSRVPDTIPPEFPPEVSPEPWHPPLDLPQSQSEQNPDLNTIVGELTAETTETGFSVPEVPEVLEVLEPENSNSNLEEPLPAVLTVNDEPRDPLLDALPFAGVLKFEEPPHWWPVVGSYWRFAVGGALVKAKDYDGNTHAIRCDYVPDEPGSFVEFVPEVFINGHLVPVSEAEGKAAESQSNQAAPKVDQRTALFDIESRATNIAAELQCRPNHVAVLVDTVLQTVEQLCTMRSVSQSSPVFSALRGLLASHPGQILSNGLALALDGPLKEIVQLEVQRIAARFDTECREVKRQHNDTVKADVVVEGVVEKTITRLEDVDNALIALAKEIARLDSRMDDIERARIAGENRKAKRYADAGKARRVPKAEALAGRRSRDKTLRESKARQALDDIGMQEQPVKRGRGRPPKNAGGPAAKPSEAPPAAVKRGRGRPPKNAGGPAAKPSKAPPAAVKRGRGRPPKAAKVADVPRSFASVDLMNKIQKFIGAPNPKVQHLMSRIPAANLSKFLAAANRGMPAMDVMKLTTWTPSEQGAFAAWYFSNGAAAR